MLLAAAKKAVPPGLKLRSKLRWVGNRWRLNIPDRVFLEDRVIPYYRALPGVRTVLDIGVDWYTRSYPKLFPDQDYWTIDVDPAKSRYAGGQHHTLSITELGTVFGRGQFDLIICNGVFGWGIQSTDEVNTALSQCAHILKPGGHLVIGWNDTPEHRVENLPDLAANHFDPFIFPPVDADTFMTETSYRHRFDFFQAKATRATDS